MGFTLRDSSTIERYEWNDEEDMHRENSFGILPGSKRRVNMITLLRIRFDDATGKPLRGNFEWYDEEDYYYCEGGLWFDEHGHMSDYDGNFSLPPRVQQFLYDEKMLDDWTINYWANSKRITVTEEDRIRLKIGEEE